MEKELFENLLSSAKQARDISKGKAKPSRRFVFKPEDISKIRKELSLSQNDFATLLRVPTATLRNWEQGRTTPDAPAQTLLLIAHKRPNILSEVSESNIVYGTSHSHIRSHQKAGSIKTTGNSAFRLKKAAKKKASR